MIARAGVFDAQRTCHDAKMAGWDHVVMLDLTVCRNGCASSGLESRPRSCPFTSVAPGSGVRVIGGRKFPRAKPQAVAKANLYVASSLNWRCRPCGHMGKAEAGGPGQRKRRVGSSGVAGAACGGRGVEGVAGDPLRRRCSSRQPGHIRRQPKLRRPGTGVGGVHSTT